MFKKFDGESVSTVTQLKSSVQKAVRNKLLEQYPPLEPYMDQILPKKEALKQIRCQDHIEILSNQSGEFLFFRHYEGPYVPTLKLLHKYPFICPLMKVDKGAISFLIQGANVMCPGLTSKTAQMTADVAEGTVVTLIAEGKQHALAVGVMKLSSEKIAKVNKGIGVENLHYLNDGLWRLKPVK